MYQGFTASIFAMKERFEVLVGCRQRGQESPCIFNYYFDYVLKVAACEIDKQFPDGWGIECVFNIPHFCTNREQRKSGRLNGVEIVIWLLYADDLVLFCKIVAEVKTIMNILNDTCSRFGLTSPFQRKDSLFSIRENVVDNAREFKYFGQTFSNKDQGSFTDLRLSKAIGNFNKKRWVLTDQIVNMTTRISLWGHGCDPASYMERKPGI